LCPELSDGTVESLWIELLKKITVIVPRKNMQNCWVETIRNVGFLNV